MQNCTVCGGKKWLAKINKKTGLQERHHIKVDNYSYDLMIYRCWRCGNVQEESYPLIPLQHRGVNASILYFDLEVSKSLYYNYGGRVPSRYLNPADLVHEYFIICWSASYVGSSTVYHDCITSKEAQKQTDGRILKRLRGLMDSADVLAGHNVDSYDIKRANTRFLLNGLEPVIGKKTYDTLKIARSKFTFESNRLDYISQRLGFRGKDNITNDDWLEIVKTGDGKTLSKVDRYCQGDVTNGKKVLEKLMKYSGKKSNYGAVTL